MANIMSMTKLKNKTSRNGFDLSRKNLFTAKVGEALPVACIECIPGDSFNIDMAWFTRTQPVNTAAYTRMREYYDWYFVPTNLLWDKFNTFVTQMTDNNQKANGINNNVQLSDEHPYFTFSQIATYINDMNADSKENFFGFNRAELTCKLLHYLDYGDFSAYLNGRPTADAPFTNAKLNPFPLLAYQKIYQDYIRDSQWEKAYAPAANINYMTGASGSNNLPISEIDMDNENMFDLRYYNWNKDYFMGLLPNSQYGDAALVSGVGSDVAALASAQLPLVLGDVSNLSYGGTPWAPVFNATLANHTVLVPANSSQVAALNPDTNSYDELSVKFTDDQLRNLRTALGLNSAYVSTDGSTGGSDDTTQQLTSVFTVLALRQAEAKQKWAEITQSQQQDYKAQVEAHFGVNVSDAYSDRCKYIGGVNGNIDIDAVTNTNLADDNEADIAGRGQGGARGSINFDTKVHGYLMCIYHAAPLLDYALDGIKRQNLKTLVTDYAIPEFDATGMVSVPLVELTTTYTPDSGVDVDTALLGYAPRYIDYKSSYDLVHGAFFNGGLDNWVAPVDKNYINEYLTSLGTAVATGAFNYQFFKIPSSVLNPIFGVDVDSSVSTDQLLINCAMDIKAVRNLDRNGLPY